MINNISGQTAVTSTPNNAPQRKDRTNMSSVNTVSVGKEPEASVQKGSGLREDTVILPAQTDEQEKGNNPDKVDYQKEILSKLIEDLRKEYIERNHYIDENAQVSVLQIVNTETDHIVGQYPSDLYLNLLTKVREIQKQLVDKII